MLVLSRGKNETVEIAGGRKAGGVTVTVIELRGDRVRLGFEGHPDVTIHRGEVQRAVDRELARAAAEQGQPQPQEAASE